MCIGRPYYFIVNILYEMYQALNNFINLMRNFIEIMQSIVSEYWDFSFYNWFEYGFATSYNDPTGGPILRSRPKWQAKDQNGILATKNNFQWMNGFLP